MVVLPDNIGLFAGIPREKNGGTLVAQPAQQQLLLYFSTSRAPPQWQPCMQNLMRPVAQHGVATLRYATPPRREQGWRAPCPLRCWGGVLDAGSFGAAWRLGLAHTRPERWTWGAPQWTAFFIVWARMPLTPTPPRLHRRRRRRCRCRHHRRSSWQLCGSTAAVASSALATTQTTLPQPTKLGTMGVALVSLNHWPGAFGWLATKELPQTAAAGNGADTSGNYGYLGMIAALGWVQRNSRSFGGEIPVQSHSTVRAQGAPLPWRSWRHLALLGCCTGLSCRAPTSR
jgi:hypothetical protein